MRARLSLGAARCGFLLALLAAGLLLVTPAQTQARSPDRPVILLSCPDGQDARDRLCQVMIQALARAAAGPQVIRQVPRGAETPARPGDLGIALHLAQDDLGALAGHLEWQTPGGPLRKGPTLRVALAGAGASQQAYEQFTNGLLKATPGLDSAIHTAS